MADKRGAPWSAAMQGPEALNGLQNAVRTDLRTEFLKRHEDKPAICIAFALMAEAAALLETRRSPDFAATALERVAQGVRRGAVMGPGDLPGSAMQVNGVDPRAAKTPAPVAAKPAAETRAPTATPAPPPPVAPPQTVAAAPAPPAAQPVAQPAAPAPSPAPAPVSKPAVKVLTPKAPTPVATPPESTPAPAPKVIATSKPAAPAAAAAKSSEVKVIRPAAAKPKPAPGGVIDLRPRGGGDAVA